MADNPREATLEELQGTEEGVSLEELQAPKKRPSNPLKQGLAGLSDFVTGLPILAGFAGAGLETLAKLPFNDKGFGDTFAEAVSSGVDADLLELGSSAREAVNEFAGIDEPRSIEDQAARLIGSLVLPVPGGFLGGAAAKGAKGLAGRAATFITPAIRVGRKSKTPFADKLVGKAGVGGTKFDPKVTGIRVGTQLGVGTSIEQGIRAGFTDMPLLFSEEALTGEAPETSIAEMTGDDVLLGGAGATLDELTTPAGVSLEDLQSAPDTEGVSLEELQGQVFDPAIAAADKAAEDAADSQTIRNAALLATAAASIFGIHKWRQVRAMARQAPLPTGTEQQATTNALSDALKVISAQDTVGGKAKAASLLAKDFGSKVGADVFDRVGHIIRALKNVNAPDSTIAQIAAQDIFDSPGQILEFIESGVLAGGKKVTTPLRRLKREFDDWDQNTKQEFVDYMSALREDASRVRATARDFIDKAEFDALTKEGRDALRAISGSFSKKHGFTGNLDELDAFLQRDEWVEIIANVRGTTERVKPGLFRSIKDKSGREVRKDFVEDPELFARIQKGEKNSDFLRVRDDLAEMNAAVLDDAVRRGVLDEAWASSIKRQFTRGDKLIYLPGREARETQAWYKRLAVNMGMFTTEGKNMNRVANFYKQSLKEGEGIGAQLDPFQATAHYLGEVMEHTNRSVAQWNIMEVLTGIKVGSGGKVTIDAPTVNPNRIGATKPPTYVGKVSPNDPLNQFGRINIAYYNYDEAFDAIHGKRVSHIRQNLGDKDPGVAQPFPEQLAMLDDAIIIQRNGDFYIFSGFERGLKTALEFDPALHGAIQKFGSFWKRLFTNFTTGKFSPFAPISGLYNIQVGALNAALRTQGGFGKASAEAIKVWKDGMKGAWDLFATKVSDDYAEILSHSLRNNSGIAEFAPNWTRSMRDVFAKRARSNLLAPIQRQTGKFHTGFNLNEIDANINEVLDQSAFYISKKFGGNVLPQFARIWNHLNSALHEGTAFGVTLRKLGGSAEGKSANQIRQARRFASDLVGDNRLKGSNMDAFNAVVPFSGAMFQAWSTMGRAMAKAGPAKTIGTVTTVVGVPTVLEVTYNSMLDPQATFDDAEGVKWTYRDYYWKGFSTDQRNNNMIIFVPGKPPWEAILVPIVPEISLFRGAVIDAMEVVFGLSEHSIMEGNQLQAGLARTFNIPLPPPVKAAISALGIDIRAGPAVDEVDGKGVSFFQTRNLPTGERVSPNMGRTRFVGGELETKVHAIIQDILGAGGTLAASVFEAVNFEDNVTPPTATRRLEAGVDAFGKSLRQQARYVNPLFGKALRNTADPEVARAVVAKKDAIERFAKGQANTESKGMFSGNIPALGASIPVSQDPITQILQANAVAYKAKIQPHVEAISQLRNQINSIGASLRLNMQVGEIPPGPISVEQRDRIIDAMNLQIDAQNHVILSILKEQEQNFIEDVSPTIGRDLTGFTFDGYTTRPNPASSTSPALPKLPQTSR